MNTRELRIGNLVYDGGSPKPFAVTDFTQNEDFYDPIPLTPEWLERCGFEKDADSDIYQLEAGRKAFRIQLSTESIIFRFDVGGDWTESMEAPEYVHQLQNLYFALTAEELTINAQ
jgi:hypothetical protein